MMSMMSVRRPEDVSVTFLPLLVLIFVFAFFSFILMRMDDVMSIIGDDEQNLSMGEELVEMCGSHLQLRDELHHLFRDVFSRGHQSNHREVIFAFFVTET